MAQGWGWGIMDRFRYVGIEWGSALSISALFGMMFNPVGEVIRRSHRGFTLVGLGIRTARLDLVLRGTPSRSLPHQIHYNRGIATDS